MKQSQRRGPGRPPKKSHDKNKSGLSQRRGPGRPPKKSHDKNKSGLANSFTAKIIRKPRTKANTGQVVKRGLSWGSHASNLHQREKRGRS